MVRRWAAPSNGAGSRRSAALGWALRRCLPGAVAGLAAGVVLSLAAAAASGGLADRGPEVVLVAIPRGTADLIARGATTSPIPADLRLRPGDTLVVRNDDTVGHRFGGYTVAPGTILTLPVASADRGRFVCSFHPSGTLALDVVEPASPLGIVASSLLVALPVGLLLAALSVFMGRLEGPPDERGPSGGGGAAVRTILDRPGATRSALPQGVARP